MRSLAFCLLATAALDLWFPFADRAGVALLGLACLALALPPRPARFKSRPRFAIPPKAVELPDLDVDTELDVAQRIAAYDLDPVTR